MLRKLDILLGLKARGGRNPTAPNRWVGNFRFGLTDYQASTPFESVWGRSMGSLLGVPHLSSRFRPRSRDSYCLSESDAHAQSWLCLGASDTDRLRLQRTRTRSYFVWCLPGGCCLIPTEGTPWFQSGRTLILEPPVSGARLHWGRNHWADVHIYICAVFGENCVELPL